MNISLPPELEAFVRQHVESGMYSSSSEVIREALRLLEGYERTKLSRLDRIRQESTSVLGDAKYEL